MPISLCANCRNAESAYQYNGRAYVQMEICVYDMTYFPRAQACAKFEAVDGLDADDDIDDELEAA